MGGKYQGITGQGLGYYIHYHAENYRKYGIALNNDDKGRAISAAQAKMETQNRLLYWANLAKRQEANLKEFEKFLNNLGDGNITQIAEELNLSKEEVEQIENSIKQEMEADYSKFTYNFENLSLENFFEGMQNLYKIKDNDSRIRVAKQSVEKLLGSVAQGIERINNLIALGNTGQANIRELNKTKSNLQQIQSDIEKFKEQAESTSGKGMYYKVNQSNKKMLNKIISDIAYIIKSAAVPTPNEQGKAAEKALALFFLKITQCCESQQQKMLEDILTGSQNVIHTTVVKKNAFLEMDYMTSLLEEKRSSVNPSVGAHYDLSSGGIVDIAGSAQTTDLIISLPDSKYGMDNVRSSLKNYQDGFSKPVHIVSGVPLLIAFNFVTTDFANHYVNFLTQNYGEETYDLDELEQYNNVFNLALILRGLIGLRDIDDADANKLNNIFIMHDRNTPEKRKYYVYDAGTLGVLAWQSAENKISGKVSLGGLYTKGERSLIKNTFSGMPNRGDFSGVNRFMKDKHRPNMVNAMRRITNVFAYTHKIKLTASITLKNI